MTEQEFERLQRRFGPDVSTWPAPHRQEALGFLGVEDKTTDANSDDDLDRLVLASALAETDEHALVRKVLARIEPERQRAFLPAMAWRPLQLPVAASGFAAMLIVAAVAGYMAARTGEGALDDELLAFALGQNGGDGSDAGILDALGGGTDEGDAL